MFIILIMFAVNSNDIPNLAIPPYSFESIVEPVSSYLENLDSFLKEQVLLLEPEVQEQARYVLAHSGKRLRPILVAYSGWHNDLADDLGLIRLGAILELVHLATLVHDDILDEANIRHGNPTVAAKYGKDAAVLVGDVLFAHALCLASEYDTTYVCRAVARATSRVCSGEITQTYSKTELNFDRTHYYRIIELKTAELFGVACRLGAKVSGKSNLKAEALSSFGIHLGCAYQIFDDVVDLFAKESEAGKTLGTDLANGKFTLPLLILLESMGEEERRAWINLYKSGQAKEALQSLDVTLATNPILGEVQKEFNASLNKAEEALTQLSSKEKEHCLRLLRFVHNLFSSFIK